MRKEVKEICVELVKLELQLKPLLQRQGELRNVIKGKLPTGEPEVVDGFLFHTFEKLNTSFNEKGLIASLGERAKMVTIPRLDTEKLDSALKLGVVKSEELEPFTKISPMKVLLVRPSNGSNGKKGNKHG